MIEERPDGLEERPDYIIRDLRSGLTALRLEGGGADRRRRTLRRDVMERIKKMILFFLLRSLKSGNLQLNLLTLFLVSWKPSRLISILGLLVRWRQQYAA